MIREWISYINNKENKKKYDFEEKSRKTILSCIFQNRKCYKCDIGKLSNFTLCCKDLSCENLKCNYKYKVYLHKQEDKIEDEILDKFLNTNNDIKKNVFFHLLKDKSRDELEYILTMLN